MTGGAGFSRDAANRSRQNRSLRQSQRESHFKSGAPELSSEPLTFIEGSDEITARFKTETIKQNRKRNLIRGIIFVALILSVVLSFVILAQS